MLIIELERTQNTEYITDPVPKNFLVISVSSSRLSALWLDVSTVFSPIRCSVQIAVKAPITRKGKGRPYGAVDDVS